MTGLVFLLGTEGLVYMGLKAETLISASSATAFQKLPAPPWARQGEEGARIKPKRCPEKARPPRGILENEARDLFESQAGQRQAAWRRAAQE